MDHDKLTLYLRNNLKSPSLDFDWTSEDNEKFFQFLEENADSDSLKKKEKLLKIREAFASYFAPVGYILFKIKNYQIRVKVFPYSTEPKESKNIAKIINIIDENKDSITNKYKGRDDQIYIDSDLRDKICTYTETIENEKVNSKELVRLSVRTALELKNEDLIMLKKDCIFIKLCDINKKHIVLKSEQNTIANRYNGIDEKEMMTFNEEHFLNDENNNFFLIIARLFINKYFLEKNINNQDYEKKVFSYIQLIITEKLMNKYDHCEDFFKGFAGYIFRRNFEEVFTNIAEIILFEIATSNEYIIDFLKYYSLNIIVINGEKYKIPSLETDGDLKWNVVSMQSIVKVYVKAYSSIKSLQQAIDKNNTENMSLSIDGLSPIEYNNKNTEDKNAIASILIKCEDNLDRCYDSLKLTNDKNEKLELEEDISLIRKDIESIREEKKILSNKTIKMRDINKFIALEKDINSMNRALEKESKILEKNKNSFESIKTALIKALISKKQLI